jgi:cell division protein FtsQ
MAARMTTNTAAKKSMVRPLEKKTEQGGRLPWKRLKKLAYVGCVALILAVIGMAVGIPRLLESDARYRLEAIEMRGLHVLKGADVLEAGQVAAEANIFALDLQGMASRIEALPWVKDVHIVRKPPDRLMVDIIERRRLAWIKMDKIYGIDQDGVLLPGQALPTEVRTELDLPVINGFDQIADSLRLGEPIKDEALRRVIHWWRQAVAYDADFCMNVSEIRPFDAESLRLYLVGDGLEVRMPLDRVEERVSVLRRYMQRVYQECPEPAYIDLRFSRQVVVGSRTTGKSS